MYLFWYKCNNLTAIPSQCQNGPVGLSSFPVSHQAAAENAETQCDDFCYAVQRSQIV